jgi:hypothetical protein
MFQWKMTNKDARNGARFKIRNPKNVRLASVRVDEYQYLKRLGLKTWRVM